MSHNLFKSEYPIVAGEDVSGSRFFVIIPSAENLTGWADRAMTLAQMRESVAPKATEAQARAGTDNETVMTPLRVSQRLEHIDGGYF